MKLSRTQLSLLRAMRHGIPLHYKLYPEAYFYLADNHERCTKAAYALLDKKMITESNGKFTLTAEGIEACR